METDCETIQNLIHISNSFIHFFFFFSISQITCSGLFELRLKSFRNDNGVNSLGRCCSEKLLSNGSCQGSCKTRFRICLKQYQAEIDTTSSCTFGSAATQILGDNTFNLTQFTTATRNQPQKGPSINPIRFPFEFTWPVSIFFFLPFVPFFRLFLHLKSFFESLSHSLFKFHWI